MRRIRKSSMVLPAAIAALALLPGAGPATAKSSSAGLTNFHGTVASVSTANRTVRLRRSSGTITFRVTASTEFERLSGLSALTRGKSIEIKARKIDGRWTARQIEPGGASSDDDSGDDNGGGRNGSDDAPGDDHGSGGHGSDD